MKYMYIIVFLVFTLSACQKQKKPTQEEILLSVQKYLDKNQTPNHVIIASGAIDFSSSISKYLIPKYKQLNDEGYIYFGKKISRKNYNEDKYGIKAEFIPDKNAKKLDLYEMRLTEKTQPFLLSKKQGRSLLKSSEMTTKNALIKKIEARANQTYRVEIELKWNKTPFSILEELDDAFLKKAFLIQNNTENMWEVAGELQ